MAVIGGRRRRRASDLTSTLFIITLTTDNEISDKIHKATNTILKIRTTIYKITNLIVKLRHIFDSLKYKKEAPAATLCTNGSRLLNYYCITKTYKHIFILFGFLL